MIYISLPESGLYVLRKWPFELAKRPFSAFNNAYFATQKGHSYFSPEMRSHR